MQVQNSLIALVGMFALIGVISAVTPLTTQGQGGSDDAPPPKDVNVVNTPNVNLVGAIALDSSNGCKELSISAIKQRG